MVARSQSSPRVSTMALVFVVLCVVQMVFAVWPVVVEMAFKDGVGVFELSLARDALACCILWLASVSEEASQRRPITLRTMLLDAFDEGRASLFLVFRHM